MFKLTKLNPSRENAINNQMYDEMSSQQAKYINKLTKKAPIKIYFKQKGQYFSLFVPYWTTYLFVENGFLYASGSGLSIQQKFKRGKTEKFEAIEIDDEHDHCIIEEDELKINNMSNIYLFNDVELIEKVVKLSGFNNKWTPRVFVLDRHENMIEIDKCKLSKENKELFKELHYKSKMKRAEIESEES